MLVVQRMILIDVVFFHYIDLQYFTIKSPYNKRHNCRNHSGADHNQNKKVVPDIVIAQKCFIVIFGHILVFIHG